MIPFPKNDFSEIVSDLNHIDSHFDIEDFRFNLKKYRNIGLDLINTDPEKGFTLLGIVSCVENKVDEMHSYHKRAVEVSRGSYFSLAQYACSLAHLNLYNEALEYGFKATKVEPDAKEMLQFVVKYAYLVGKDDIYEEFKEKMIKLKFVFEDPDSFTEDNPEVLRKMIDTVDTLIDENPQLVVKPDPEFKKFVEDLIDGVVL